MIGCADMSRTYHLKESVVGDESFSESEKRGADGQRYQEVFATDVERPSIR